MNFAQNPLVLRGLKLLLHRRSRAGSHFSPIGGGTVLLLFSPKIRLGSTLAPSLFTQVRKSGICVHVKTIRLNGPSVILPSADCRLL